MNQALAMYSRIDATNFEDIQQSVIEVKNHLDLLAQVFHEFDSRPYFSGELQAQLACLNFAAEFVMRTQKLERRFMGLVKRLKAAYDSAAAARRCRRPSATISIFTLPCALSSSS